MTEIPAYPADGGEGHLLLTLTKRETDTEYAVREVAKQLGIARAEIGVAGLKDRHALTTQWISIPRSCGERLSAFEHPNIELGAPQPHQKKLRRGHLRGNRFEIVLRDLAVESVVALARVQAKLDVLAREGLNNYYGPQRFGIAGRNVTKGLRALKTGKFRRGDIVVSAGQSALFNLYVVERIRRGQRYTVLAGDILQKRTTGGLFCCDDPKLDQTRLDAGELVITGPMVGSKMRAPPAGSAAAALEASIIERAGLSPSALIALGRRVPGTRRRLDIEVQSPEVRRASSVQGAEVQSTAAAGVCLMFTLPAGAYATNLLREVMGPLP